MSIENWTLQESRQYDRAMSMHRRAYDCDTFDIWLELARKLEVPHDAVYGVWDTAHLAKDAGMTKTLAFPLKGELLRHAQSQSC